MKCLYCKTHNETRVFKLISGRMRAVYSCKQCGKAFYRAGHVWIEYNE